MELLAVHPAAPPQVQIELGVTEFAAMVQLFSAQLMAPPPLPPQLPVIMQLFKVLA
jgi:hypothetical protein